MRFMMLMIPGGYALSKGTGWNLWTTARLRRSAHPNTREDCRTDQIASTELSASTENCRVLRCVA
jgi:hypothetical protein